MAAPFSYEQAREIAETLGRRSARFLFIGKCAAIILGFPDTTQDADLFVEKSPSNGRAVVDALLELGFPLTPTQQDEIVRGKDFVQIRSGPFDVDLVFAPDGLETFQEAWSRAVIQDGLPVCHIDDVIRSKEAANRIKDRESLPRLKAFREWWVKQRRAG